MLDFVTENAGFDQFSDAMNQCCGGCLGLRGCFINCWIDLLGYSQACSDCWGDTCQCSSLNCLLPCLGGAACRLLARRLPLPAYPHAACRYPPTACCLLLAACTQPAWPPPC